MAEDECPQRMEPKDRKEWRAWLERNHDVCRGVQLVIRKKNSPGRGVTYEEAVEEAVAFGWIDSKVNALDERSFLQLYTPRKRGSIWSKTNKERVARLTAQGKMAPAGLEKVKAAKRDGSWTLLDRVESLTVPDDLKRAFIADRKAQKTFKAFPDSAKKAIIYWVESARRPETRDKRISKVIELAREGRSPFS